MVLWQFWELEKGQISRFSLICSFASSFSDGFIPVLTHLNNSLSALIQMINRWQALNLGRQCHYAEHYTMKNIFDVT